MAVLVFVVFVLQNLAENIYELDVSSSDNGINLTVYFGACEFQRDIVYVLSTSTEYGQ